MIECGLLNRLRGTGVLKHFGTLKVFNKEIRINFNGNHLYGLYLAVVVGILTMNALAGVAVVFLILILFYKELIKLFL
jgi:hypothetical protein